MAWLNLHIEAHNQNADLLSDALMEIGALSVSIEDANAETLDEQPIFGEPGDPPPGIWNENIVTALFNDDINISEVISALEEATGYQNLKFTSERVAEQDWVRATQSLSLIHI
jgi:ribosomal protein L11 methyltransferase